MKNKIIISNLIQLANELDEENDHIAADVLTRISQELAPKSRKEIAWQKKINKILSGFIHKDVTIDEFADDEAQQMLMNVSLEEATILLSPNIEQYRAKGGNLTDEDKSWKNKKPFVIPMFTDMDKKHKIIIKVPYALNESNAKLQAWNIATTYKSPIGHERVQHLVEETDDGTNKQKLLDGFERIRNRKDGDLLLGENN